MDPASPRHLVGTPPQSALGRLHAVDRIRRDGAHRQPDRRTFPCGPRDLRPATLPDRRWVGLDTKTLGCCFHPRPRASGHRLCHQRCGPNWPQSASGVLSRSLARTPGTPPAAGPPKQRLFHTAQPRHQCGHHGLVGTAVAHNSSPHRGGHHEVCARCTARTGARRSVVCGNGPATTRST